jgi:chromosome segregation ATPase
MRTKWTTIWFFPAALAGVALAFTGCAESTTPDDVADAREELREEQQETAETVQETREEVADARRDAQPYAVNKPVTGDTHDEAVEAHQDIADAQHDARQEILDQKADEAEAATDLRTVEQQAAATKARDEFVAETERMLADVEARIDQLKAGASSADGAAKENLDRQIDALDNQHSRVEEALDHLKTAELADWQTHRQQVRTAMQELNSSLGTIR